MKIRIHRRSRWILMRLKGYGTSSVSRRIYDLTPAKGLLLATRKRVSKFSECHLVLYLVLFELVLDVLLYLLCVFSCRINIVPPTQNCRFPYLYFRFPCLSWISSELLPLRNPIKLETDSFGGISTSICMCSGHTSASLILTPFHSHSSRSIFPISARFSP